MTPERQKLAEAIFKRALALAPKERDAALAKDCGSDAELLGEVAGLLACHDDAAGPLDDPKPMGDSFAHTLPRVGDRPIPIGGKLGHYTINGILGSGGMGVVYEAQQHRPSRTVALKVIRPGYADRTTLRRFEFEAELLGRLQHPGIAQIYEAGAADAGHGPQPFFAMELVKGPPLSEYCDARKLGPRERLALMAMVCDAIDHAHQRGVIHRDLKPPNILVDESGQPKVLDFGVARLSNSDQRMTIMSTTAGQIIGTLAYMSPEQVSGDSNAVDTRADVYSLGVILYELLGGRLPHTLKGLSIPEAIRVICEQDPPRLGSLSRSFGGDLDTIVSRAMDKDRARRYQSAHDVALEIRRYLKDEPIDAKRDSAWYVVRKQVRRHRTLAASGAAILLLLAASSVVFATLAHRNSKLAQEREEQRIEAVAAQAKAAAELSANRIAQARLLTATGSPTAAEPLLWREFFDRPGDLQPRWALREFYSRVPSFRAVHAGGFMPQCLAVSPDGATIAWSEGHNSVVIWDGRLTKQVARLADGMDGPQSIDYDSSGRYLAAGDFAGNLRLFDLQAGTSRRVRACKSKVAKVCIAPGARQVATTGGDGVVRLWSFPDLSPIRSFETPGAGAVCATYSSDGTCIAFQELINGPVVIHDASTGDALASIPIEDEVVFSIAAIPKSASLLLGVVHPGRHDGATIIQWSLGAGREERRWHADVPTADSIEVLADGRTLLISGGALTLWDIPSGTLIRTLARDESNYFMGRTVADGSQIVSASRQRDVRLWEAAPGLGAHRLECGPGGRSVSFSSDAKLLAVGSSKVTVFELPSKRVVGEFALPNQSGAQVNFSPDGRWFATGKGSLLRVRSAITGKPALDAAIDKATVEDIQFSPDGTLFAGAFRDGPMKVWRIQDWSDLGPVTGFKYNPWALSFAADSKSLLAVEPFTSVRTLNLQSLTATATPTGDGSWRMAATSPDGVHAVLASSDRPPQIWDTVAWKSLHALEGHSQAVTAARYSRDGSLVATASSDGTACVWDASSGLLLASFACAIKDLSDVEMSPDGAWLAAAGEDGAVIWDLSYYDRHIAGQAEWEYSRLRESLSQQGTPVAWPPLDLAGLLPTQATTPLPPGPSPAQIKEWLSEDASTQATSPAR